MYVSCPITEQHRAIDTTLALFTLSKLHSTKNNQLTKNSHFLFTLSKDQNPEPEKKITAFNYKHQAASFTLGSRKAKGSLQNKPKKSKTQTRKTKPKYAFFWVQSQCSANVCSDHPCSHVCHGFLLWQP